MKSQRRSPRQLSKTGQGQKQNHLEGNCSNKDVTVQALRLAIHRFSRSKAYHRGKLFGAEETLAMFKGFPTEDAVGPIALQELQVAHYMALLTETEAALCVFYRLYIEATEGTV
jgi:hypothetical protein